MSQVAAGKTAKFSYSIVMSDDRLKLFFDGQRILPEPAKKPEAKPEENPQANTETEAKVKTEPEIPFVIETEELMAILPPAVWKDCLHLEVIKTICEEMSRGEEVKERRIAKGTAAIDGKDGRILFMVRKMSKKAEMQEDLHGFVDFKDLHLFENVRAGTIIAKVFPPEEGKAGLDPLGKSLPARPGKPAKFLFDQSIKTQNHAQGNGQDLVAVTDGYLLEESGRLAILDELNIGGDIDYKTGSIDFIGKVFVRGDVLPGFIVRGKKGVFIKGSVSEATITSSDGPIEIAGFLGGSISSKIEARQDVSLSVAQQAEVYAGLNIQVSREARTCNFKSGGVISGEKALIISGDYFTPCGLEAKEIGSKMASNTVIQMSSDLALSHEVILLNKQILEHEKALALMNAHLGPFAVSSAGLAKLSDKHRERLAPLLAKKNSIDVSLVDLKLKRDDLLSKEKVSNVFRVNCHSKIHAGVRIAVGDNKFMVAAPIEGSKTIEFNFDKKAFEVGDYKPLECSIAGVSKT